MFSLGLADSVSAVDHLPVEVAEIDLIIIDDGQPTDTGSSEILDHRCPEPARPDHRNMAAEQHFLAFFTEGRQDHLAGIAFELRVCQHGVNPGLSTQNRLPRGRSHQGCRRR